ncbi:MAG TPA: outer membrane lipoprotein chaperone LolA [Nevskiaceae bacterium]|nr:outer membrane lipoprotein chaperone LolA [Nevskiaceae bacterium]
MSLRAWMGFAPIFLCVSFTARAAAPDTAAATVALHHFLSGVSTLTADFTQTQTDGTGKVVQTQSGVVWLQRATSSSARGRFRWDYEKPYKQLIVCDGKKIWVYDPDLQQVTVRSAKQALAGSPSALLAQHATLTDAFRITGTHEDQGQQVVQLVPLNRQSDFKSVTLALAAGVPVRMVFRDQLGDATAIRFTDVKTNLKLAASRFEFTPPKGVAVVGAGAPDPD